MLMTNTQHPDSFTRYQDAAEVLGISPLTLQRWRKSGKLVWPRGTPMALSSLMELRDRIASEARAWRQQFCKGRRKHLTLEAAAKAKYEAVKRFRYRNPEKVKVNETFGRRLLRHPLFAEMKTEMIKHYGRTCLRCKSSEPLCVDHVIPLSKGGQNRPANLQTLCRRCNTSKGDSDTDYRPDHGAWLLSRWGGWIENGTGKGVTDGRTLRANGPGSGRDCTAYARHMAAVQQWRADQSILVNPTVSHSLSV